MSNEPSDLVKLNQFVQSARGVYVSTGADTVEFDYSDGQASENQLRQILENATDLGSTSYELKQQITDWPSEYHLSPVRANLLRAVDLSGVKRVLELGCGCGSITRYLAEQEGIEVDAVEGSLVRAELAALRCADQQNVMISAANFNEIQLPQNYYDLVLFVGVTEYAGRFSNAPTDQQALQELLVLAKKTSKNDGLVLVAIENRTGMKYVMGANEDHYALPYVGIHDYPDLQGIRTYTKKQWQSQIAQAGFNEHEFIYPFPDYKIPTVFLNESYINRSPKAFAHLESMQSRDYTSNFTMPVDELLLWQSASVSGTLGDYANSFLILMGSSKQSVQTAAKFDFVHLPDFTDKPEYCVSTYKIKNSADVYRKHVVEGLSEHHKDSIKRQDKYRQSGLPLSIHWLRYLTGFNDRARFENQLRNYFEILSNSNKLSVQMMPQALMALSEGDKQQIVSIAGRFSSAPADQVLTAQLVYFKGVLWFAKQNARLISQHNAYQPEITSLGDWVKYTFSVIGKMPSDTQISEWLDFENDFQKTVKFDYQPLSLRAPLDSWSSTEPQPELPATVIAHDSHDEKQPQGSVSVKQAMAKLLACLSHYFRKH